MQIELTRNQVSTIKQALQYGIQRINDYSHHDYETKKNSRKPLENAMSALPDLRNAKEKNNAKS